MIEDNELINNLDKCDYKKILTRKITSTSKDVLHMTYGITSFLYPFSNHVRILNTLDYHLRYSYINKKPIEYLNKVYYHQPLDIHSSLIALVGTAGTGRTSIIKAFIDSKKIIRKDNYNQIPIIYIKSNGKASIRWLAIEICAYIDKEFNTNHSSEIENMSNDVIIHKIRLLLAIYNVGMLAIDDYESIEGRLHKEIQDFIKALDTLGVSVLIIGSPSIENLFTHTFLSVLSFSTSLMHLHEINSDEYDKFINEIKSSYPFKYINATDDFFSEAMYFAKGNLLMFINLLKEKIISYANKESFSFDKYKKNHSLLIKAKIQIDGHNKEAFADIREHSFNNKIIKEDNIYYELLGLAIRLNRDEDISSKLIKEVLKENYNVIDFDTLAIKYEEKYINYIKKC